MAIGYYSSGEQFVNGVPVATVDEMRFAPDAIVVRNDEDVDRLFGKGHHMGFVAKAGMRLCQSGRAFFYVPISLLSRAEKRRRVRHLRRIGTEAKRDSDRHDRWWPKSRRCIAHFEDGDVECEATSMQVNGEWVYFGETE